MCVRVAHRGGDAPQIAHTADLFGKFGGGQLLHPVEQSRAHKLFAAQNRAGQQRKQPIVVVLAGEGSVHLVGQVFVQLPGRYMAGDESTPTEQRLHEPEERPAHAVLAGKDASQLVGVPERIGQVLHRDIFTVGFQQAGAAAP